MNLLQKVQKCDGFFDQLQTHIYQNDLIWFVGVRSKKDKFNCFDDEFYVMKGRNQVSKYPITTNTGAYGLLQFDQYNNDGVAVLKSNQIVYNAYKKGFHRGIYKCLKQNKPFPFYRDNNKNKLVEEIGELNTEDIIGANIHASTYHLPTFLKGRDSLDFTNKENVRYIDVKRKKIGMWSTACQVFQYNVEYWNWWLIYVEGSEQKEFTYCILKN